MYLFSMRLNYMGLCNPSHSLPWSQGHSLQGAQCGQGLQQNPVQRDTCWALYQAHLQTWLPGFSPSCSLEYNAVWLQDFGGVELHQGQCWLQHSEPSSALGCNRGSQLVTTKSLWDNMQNGRCICCFPKVPRHQSSHTVEEHL